MISISIDGTKVVMKVSLPELSEGVFPFSFQCGEKWIAMALYKFLVREFGDRVQRVRRAEYEKGLKDARKPKAKRADFFKRYLD